MRSRTVRLIAAKELLDTLRDRRTLFVALVLPLLLYPALLIGLTQIISATQANLAEEKQRVMVDGTTTPPELIGLLESAVLEPLPISELGHGEEVRSAVEELAEAEGAAADTVRAKLKKLMANEDISAALLCESGFGAALDSGRRGEARLVSNPTNEKSKEATRKIRVTLQNLADAKRTSLRKRFPLEAERLQFAERPVQLDVQEVASKSQKGAYSFAPLLGIMIVLMALTGAFYPAVDLVAGEKERGTMETLLVAPVTRREIVLGKFLTIWVVAMVTALLNLGVMALTFSKLAGMAGSGSIEFEMPAGAIVAVTLILIPTSALFGAVALALSSFATSYKEGQHYLSPLFLVARRRWPWWACCPTSRSGTGSRWCPWRTSSCWSRRCCWEARPAGPAIVAIISTLGYALIALMVSVEIFKRESVLFRSGSGDSYDEKSLSSARRGLPQEKQAVLLFFTTVALMYFMSRGGREHDRCGAGVSCWRRPPRSCRRCSTRSDSSSTSRRRSCCADFRGSRSPPSSGRPPARSCLCRRSIST